MPAPDWLTARPIAHRGLHGLDPALVENSLGAADAAMAAGFSVEVDLRLTADEKLAVFHDDTLARVCGRPERVRDLPLDRLREIPFLVGEEEIPSLDDLLALAHGRAPLVLELKSPGDRAGCAAMARAFSRALSRYGGEVAVMSFDPDLVELLARALPDEVPRGILAGDAPEAPTRGSLMDRVIRDELLHAPRTRPDFVGYHFRALPRVGVAFQRRVRGLPVLAWTVRGEADRTLALRHADQIIFEGFLPPAP